jgi:hypothetical protein
MNLASRSDAEDSNTFEITGFGALIGFIANCQLSIADLKCPYLGEANWQSAIGNWQ